MDNHDLTQQLREDLRQLRHDLAHCASGEEDTIKELIRLKEEAFEETFNEND